MLKDKTILVVGVGSIYTHKSGMNNVAMTREFIKAITYGYKLGLVSIISALPTPLPTDKLRQTVG
jgi:hypothetical protein